jgi:hypothetical protein
VLTFALQTLGSQPKHPNCGRLRACRIVRDCGMELVSLDPEDLLKVFSLPDALGLDWIKFDPQI